MRNMAAADSIRIQRRNLIILQSDASFISDECVFPAVLTSVKKLTHDLTHISRLETSVCVI